MLRKKNYKQQQHFTQLHTFTAISPPGPTHGAKKYQVYYKRYRKQQQSQNIYNLIHSKDGKGQNKQSEQQTIQSPYPVDRTLQLISFDGDLGFLKKYLRKIGKIRQYQTGEGLYKDQKISTAMCLNVLEMDLYNQKWINNLQFILKLLIKMIDNNKDINLQINICVNNQKIKQIKQNKCKIKDIKLLLIFMDNIDQIIKQIKNLYKIYHKLNVKRKDNKNNQDQNNKDQNKKYNNNQNKVKNNDIYYICVLNIQKQKIICSQIYIHHLLHSSFSLVTCNFLSISISIFKPTQNSTKYKDNKNKSKMFIRLHFKLFGCDLIFTKGNGRFDSPMIHAQSQWDSQNKTVHDTKIMQSIINEYNGQYSTSHNLCRCYIFIFLHFKPSIIVIVIIYPSNPIEMLILPCNHIYKHSKGLYHADTPA